MNKFHYDPEVDSVYISIEDRDVLESEEIAEGIIVDYDIDNNIIAVELLGIKTINPNNYAKLKCLLPESAQLQLKEFFPYFVFV
jgi:uncharacterized protein YuzE